MRRPIESDQLAGKNSIPVRIGRDKAVIYHRTILVLGLMSTALYVFMNYSSPWQLVFLLVLPLLVKNAKAVKYKKEASELDPYLKQMALTTLLFVILFGVGQLM